MLKLMLVYLEFSFLFAAFLLGLSGTGFGADKSNPGMETTARNNRQYARGGHVGFGIDSGFGTFQDIQTPVNTFEGERADGTPAGPENVTHFGIPVAGYIALSYRTAAFEPRAQLSGVHVSSIMDSSKSPHATYGRFDLGIGTAFHGGKYNRGRQRGLALEGDFHGRRAIFANRSTAHYVDSVIPSGGIGWYQDRGFNFMVSGGASLASRLAYDAGHGGNNGAISGSTSSITELKTLFMWRTEADTAVSLGYEYERTQLSIADTGAYNAFGLAVPIEDQSSRAYSLSTNLIKIGYAHRF